MPEILPDELVYSYIARYAAAKGQSAEQASQDLIGRRTSNISRTFPSPLSRFAQAAGSTWVEMLKGHTLFPYYTAFISTERADAFADLVAWHSGKPGVVARSITATSTLPTTDAHYFCPECAEEDKSKYGIRYWHRLHQLPLVVLCPDHGCDIRQAARIKDKSSRTLQPADEETMKSRSLTPKAQVEAKDRSQAIKLASDCRVLLSGNYPSDMDRYSADRIGIGLAAKGYRSQGDRLAWSQIAAEVDEELAWVRRIWPALWDELGMRRWLLLVCRPKGGNRRTEHVQIATMAMQALPDREPAFGQGPWDCVNPLSDHDGEPVVTKIERRRANGVTIGRFFCKCGYVYTRSQNDAGEISATKFSAFGSTLSGYVEKAVAEGWTLARAARGARLTRNTLERAVKREMNISPWLHSHR